MSTVLNLTSALGVAWEAKPSQFDEITFDEYYKFLKDTYEADED